ncbi:gamma-butyrobetaine dioxygenase isoform X1 [Patella vulgata]|uniref:gamma-butyrobetaine dioxygenase isoform X1 n=1 Tax=Patella vulgata TaxID=6465 RepID=UPI0024A86B34|nr:gamma-butyrobetaine dioxygenase isoform X1 [Patella vulgata]
MSTRIIHRLILKFHQPNQRCIFMTSRQQKHSTYRTRAAGEKITKLAGSASMSQMAASKPENPISIHQEMVDRQVLFPAQFKVAGDDRIQQVNKINDGRMVEIIWKDGKHSKFHSIWLRHTCHCPSCKIDVSGQPTVALTEIPLDDLYITDIDLTEENVLKVIWKEGDKTHQGYLPSSYLKTYCYSDGEIERKSNAARMTFTTDTKIPEIDYKEVMETQTGLYQWLSILGDRGLCMIRNVPTVEDHLLKVARRVALPQHTIYGDTFAVKDQPKASNAAYRNIALNLHMDQPTYESPPGIQMLHCLRFDDKIVGGDSVFADIHHIVDVFRQEHPDEFKTLCRVPVTYETLGYEDAAGRELPVHLQIRRPSISLNNYGDVVAVAYHENLTGPLQADENDVEPFYKAYQKLIQAVHAWPYKYRARLQPGDMITFQNRRALHGRAAYVSNGGLRHLQGTYINIDEFRSMLIYLQNTVGDGSPIKRMGLLDMY